MSILTEVCRVGIAVCLVSTLFVPEQSIAESNPPDTPTLLTPLDGAHGVSSPVPLRFAPADGADRYNVQVATDAAFDDIVMSVNVPSSPVDFTAPDPNATYYWRVQSVGDDGASLYSAAFSFSLFEADECGLDSAQLLTPLNGATGVSESVSLRFAAVDGADRYNVQAASDAAFSNIVFSVNVPSSPVAFSAPVPNATYFWHVQPVANGDVTCRYSPAWRFSTAPEAEEDEDGGGGGGGGGAVAPPELWAPLSGTTGVPDSVQLIFSPMASALRYNVQVATDLSFSTIVLSTNVPKPPVWFVTPTDNTTYYWRVQTVGASETSKYSTPWSFSNGGTTAPEFTDPLTLKSPEDTVRTLHKNFPEPFNPSTTIVFDNPQTGAAKLAVYDLMGRELFVIDSGVIEAGRHIYRFDASNLASGTYLYRIESAHVTETRTMTLRK